MREEKTTAARLTAFSDAVFAVIVTAMVLELKVPDQPAFSALWPLWPTAISYAVSYLFIAIIWINHYHLMRLVGPPALGLIWINFVHLFMVSLLPFATAWVARTRLASASVVLYAGPVCMRRRCLQCLRTPGIGPCGQHAGVRRYAACGEAPIALRPYGLHDRHAGCARRTAPRLRSDLRRPDPALAARGTRLHKSMTAS
jgi:hypothetical protein